MRVGNQNKSTDPRFCATTALSQCPCWLQPLFLWYQRRAQCYYCGCLSTGKIFQLSLYNYSYNSYQNTDYGKSGMLSLDYPSQNYCPHREGPLVQPLLNSESTWPSVSDSPRFSSLDRFTATSSEVCFAVGTQNQGECPPPPPPSPGRLILSCPRVNQ